MEISNAKSLLLFFLLIVCLQSCGQVSNGSGIETYDKYRMQHLDYRDSLYIMHTISAWSQINYDIYGGDLRMYRIVDSQVHYYFGGVFYSPDKLKLIVWIGMKEPNAESKVVYDKTTNKLNKLCPGSTWNTIYSMSALVGYRNDVNEKWQLYPLDNQIADCARSPDVAIHIMAQYYFKKMKFHAMWRLIQAGPEKGEQVSTPYGYNLQDKDFWDKCWLWERDTIASDGLFPFQVKGYSHYGNLGNEKLRADSIVPPKIVYPDSILRYYR